MKKNLPTNLSKVMLSALCVCAISTCALPANAEDIQVENLFTGINHTGNVTVSGMVGNNGTIDITGNLTSNGMIDNAGEITIRGTMTTNSYLNNAKSSSVPGIPNIKVTKDLIINGAKDGVAINNNKAELNIGGNVTANNGSINNTVNSIMAITGSVATQSLSNSGTASLGSLDVNGNVSSTTADLTVLGNAKVGGSLSATLVDYTNKGTMQVTGDTSLKSLTTTSGSTAILGSLSTTGNVNTVANSTVTVNGVSSITGDLNNGGTYNAGGNLTADHLYNSGKVDADNNVLINGQFQNSGIIDVAGNFTTNTGQATVNNGTMIVGGNFSATNSDFTNELGKTLTVTGDTSLKILTNKGTADLGTLTTSGNVTNDNGGTITATGDITVKGVNSNNNAIENSGTMTVGGNLTAQNDSGTKLNIKNTSDLSVVGNVIAAAVNNTGTIAIGDATHTTSSLNATSIQNNGGTIKTTGDLTTTDFVGNGTPSTGKIDVGGNMTVGGYYIGNDATINVGKNLEFNGVGLSNNATGNLTVGGNLTTSNTSAKITNENKIDVTGNVSTNQIDNKKDATLTVGQNLTTVGNVDNNGTITVTGTSNIGGDLGVGADGTYNAVGDLTANHIYNSGKIDADANVLVNGQFQNTGTIDVAGNFTTNTGQPTTNGGTMTVGGNFNAANSDFTNNKNLTVVGNVVTKSFTNGGITEIGDDTHESTLTTSIINATTGDRGDITLNKSATSTKNSMTVTGAVNGGNLTIYDNATLGATTLTGYMLTKDNSQVTINGDVLADSYVDNHYGNVTINGDLKSHLNNEGTDSGSGNSGTMHVTGDVDVKSYFHNCGTLYIDKDFTVKSFIGNGNENTPNGYIHVLGNVIGTNESSYNNSNLGTFIVDGYFDTKTSIDNTGALTVKEYLNVLGDVTNKKSTSSITVTEDVAISGKLESNGTVTVGDDTHTDSSLTAHGIQNNGGTIKTTGDLISTTSVGNGWTSGKMDIGGNMKVDGYYIGNDGTINVAKDLEFNGAQIQNNAGSSITVEGNLRTNDTAKITNDGSIQVGNDTTTSKLEVLGDISSSDSSKTGKLALNNVEFSQMGAVANQSIIATNGTVINANNPYSFTNDSLNLDNSTMNIEKLTLSPMKLNNFGMSNGTINILNIDVDTKQQTMGRIVADSYTSGITGTTVVNNLNLSGIPNKSNFKILFAEDAGYAQTVKYNGTRSYLTPIYQYKLDYGIDKTDNFGYFNFNANGGAGGTGFNPAVIASPVASQAGATATMNQTFNYAFQNADNFMNIPYLERMAINNANKYAISPTGNATDVGTYSPLFTKNDTSSVWVKPYASFENIPLKNGPKVSNITYGTLVGYDTEYTPMKKGWGRVWTGYIGYNGASQRYSGVDSTQNGGLLGGTLTLYKGNFFNATTISAGASVANNRTMYGSEDFTMLLAGVGNKAGYNFEFKEGKIIIQPSLLMSYTFVNTFDYTNAAGVRIKSDPLHSIQLSPGVKFIGNTKNGWQPYASVGMVWNLLNETKVTANNVTLPQMSIKPYVQYGVGVQKRFKDNCMAFGQAMIQNGGRNGVSLTAGFRWSLGKEGKPIEKVQNTQPKVIKQINKKQKLAENTKA